MGAAREHGPALGCLLGVILGTGSWAALWLLGVMLGWWSL